MLFSLLVTLWLHTVAIIGVSKKFWHIKSFFALRSGVPNKNTVARLVKPFCPPPKFWAGYATGCYNGIFSTYSSKLHVEVHSSLSYIPSAYFDASGSSDAIVCCRVIVRASCRCQAKFLTTAKNLTYYCLSVTLFLRVKELSLAIIFLVYVVYIKTFGKMSDTHKKLHCGDKHNHRKMFDLVLDLNYFSFSNPNPNLSHLPKH